MKKRWRKKGEIKLGDQRGNEKERKRPRGDQKGNGERQEKKGQKRYGEIREEKR